MTDSMMLLQHIITVIYYATVNPHNILCYCNTIPIILSSNSPTSTFGRRCRSADAGDSEVWKPSFITLLWYTLLYSTLLYYTLLYSTILYYTILYYINYTIQFWAFAAWPRLCFVQGHPPKQKTLYIYIYISLSLYIYIYVYIVIYIYIYISIYLSLYLYIYIYIYVYTCSWLLL